MFPFLPLLLASCATDPAATAAATDAATVPDDGVDDIQTSLDHLAALQIVEVGALINDAAEESNSCYGPCPEDEAAIAAEEAQQAERLDRLVDLADATAVAEGRAETCGDDTVSANLRALAALRIVEIGAFLTAEPENNPYCYNFPCVADIAAAEEITCARAETLDRIVRGAEGL